MGGENIQGQTTAQWMERRNDIKSRIDEIKFKLNALPNDRMAGMAAGEAKARVDSFLYQKGGGEESRIPENNLEEFKRLKADAADKTTTVKAVKKQRRELSEELTRFNKEFAKLKYPIEIEGFSVDGLRKFVRECVKHWVDTIKTANTKLNSLESKREELKTEQKKFEYRPESLDETALLDITVEARALQHKKIKQLQRKKEAVEDLLQQIEDAIEGNKKQIESTKKEFADALTSAVDAYTQAGMVKTAKELRHILDEDEKYNKTAVEVCQELLSETKTNSVHVFNFTGGTLPVQTHLFHDNMARDKTGAMVKIVLEQFSELSA